MKNLNAMQLNLLTNNELENIYGGDGFFQWVGEIVGAGLHVIVIFGQTAAEYQASLPANLKK